MKRGSKCGKYREAGTRGGSFNTEVTYPKPRLCLPSTLPTPILPSTLRSVLLTFLAIFPSIALESLLEEKEDIAYRRRCLDQLTTIVETG